MAFFQSLGKQLAGAAQTVSKRTGEAAEIGRLNGKLQGIREDIDAMYTQVGKAFYATRQAQGEHEAARKFCEKIDELQGEIARIQIRIDKVKQQRRCPECGGIQPTQSKFCASCGTKLPEEKPPVIQPEQAEAITDDEVEKSDVEVEINWPGEAAEEQDTTDASDEQPTE